MKIIKNFLTKTGKLLPLLILLPSCLSSNGDSEDGGKIDLSLYLFPSESRNYERKAHGCLPDACDRITEMDNAGEIVVEGNKIIESHVVYTIEDQHILEQEAGEKLSEAFAIPRFINVGEAFELSRYDIEDKSRVYAFGPFSERNVSIGDFNFTFQDVLILYRIDDQESEMYVLQQGTGILLSMYYGTCSTDSAPTADTDLASFCSEPDVLVYVDQLVDPV